MTKKNIVVLTVTLLAVAGFYLYLFKDSFRKPTIQIFHTIRLNSAALRHPAGDGSGEDVPNVITFGMGRDYQLTSVKIVPLAELETNRFAHPLWELTSDSNSVPIKAFSYGLKIRGMHSPVKGAKPDPLVPNVTYRLLLEAHSVKGQHDFKITEENHLAQ